MKSDFLANERGPSQGLSDSIEYPNFVALLESTISGRDNDENGSWIYVEQENVFIKEVLKNEQFEIIEAKIEGSSTMKTHEHKRPNNGVEIYYFPNAHKKFKLLPEDRTIDTEEPLIFTFKSLEQHGITNLMEDDLIFYAFYSPPFQEGESKVII